jgi:transposase-like protein
MQAAFKRWSSKRKAQVVMAIWSGETTIQKVCKEYTLSQETVESWLKWGIANIRKDYDSRPWKWTD